MQARKNMTFWCHLDVIFMFKMLDKLSKKFFWLMISIYEICKSYAKVLLELSLIAHLERVLLP